MRRTTTLSIASLLLLSAGSVVAADAGSPTVTGQQGMFDGVRLTEHQREQMRDLMQQVRHDMPLYDLDEVEKMYRLVTTENFDESAARAQITKMLRAQVERQVEMARVRNQMYNLLTPEQKATLNQRHQQNMAEMRQQMSILNQHAQNLRLSPPGDGDDE